MQFRWDALEGREDGNPFGELGSFGVYTGDIAGTWGVSTLTVNPISGRPYVRMFDSEDKAVRYARDRVAKGPLLYYPRKPGQKRPDRNPRARVYYVVQMPEHQYDPETGDRALLVKYRVLRGHMSGVDPQEGILVFSHGGTTAAGADRWKLSRVQSIAIIDPDYPKTRARKPR